MPRISYSTNASARKSWFAQRLVLPSCQGPKREAAAFDTRLGSALAGGAGYGIAHKLHGHGYYLWTLQGRNSGCTVRTRRGDF
jgi:hypothetical protein